MPTVMAFLGLLEGQQNQPKPHADLFSDVMVKSTFDLLASSTTTPDEETDVANPLVDDDEGSETVV